MTAPSTMSDELKASVIPYTNFRIALATAILGSVGASLGWLILLVYKARDWELAIAVTVGAALGFSVHWLRHYVRDAARERRGEAAVHHGSNRHLVALLWATGFGLLALSSEHLVAHMVATFLRPFLVSFASLAPAGAIIGWSMSRGRSQDKNFLIFLVEGLCIGGSIAVVTGIIWTIAFGDTPWFALVSWWGLIGLGTHAMTRPERNAVKIGDPIAAMALVFVGMLLINLMPTTLSTYEHLGPYSGLPVLVRSMAGEMQESPGVPATFWDEANRLAEARQAAEKAKSEGTVAQQATRKQSPDTSGSKQSDVLKAMHNLTSDPPKVSAVRREWAQIEATWQPLLRSWIVILFFAFGAGAAPRMERALRPVDYPNSETFRRDIGLAIVMVALLVVACLVGRYGPGHEKAHTGRTAAASGTVLHDSRAHDFAIAIAGRDQAS